MSIDRDTVIAEKHRSVCMARWKIIIPFSMRSIVEIDGPIHLYVEGYSKQNTYIKYGNKDNNLSVSKVKNTCHKMQVLSQSLKLIAAYVQIK